MRNEIKKLEALELARRKYLEMYPVGTFSQDILDRLISGYWNTNTHVVYEVHTWLKNDPSRPYVLFRVSVDLASSELIVEVAQASSCISSELLMPLPRNPTINGQ